MAFFSTKKHQFTTIFIIFLILSLQHTTTAAPPSKFVDSTREVITILEVVILVISDCLDLLDISSNVLTRSVSATQNPKGKGNSTGSLSSDLRTWLSAVMVNPETCMDGLEGSNSIVKRLISSRLGKVITLVTNLLAQVVPPISDEFTAATAEGGYPSWVKEKDMKLQVNGVNADAVVAADGSGSYSTVMDAVLAAPDYSMKRFVIYVKRGIYKEYVEIKKKKWNIMMVGEGMDSTVISGNRNYVDGLTTFRTATFAVSGRGFIARDISFENTAGPEKHQAVALRSDSDLSVFYRCGIFGYQDSLYPHTMRQFYRECKITGTVDFIFGDATVVFQNCEIKARKGLATQKNTITAQGRIDPHEPTEKVKGKSILIPEKVKNKETDKRKKSSHDSGSRRESKKSKHSKDKNPSVTVVPLNEEFLEQSYREWGENPLAASIRVISEMGRIQELERTKYRAEIQERYIEVVKERDELKAELSSKIGSYNKVIHNLHTLKKERDGLTTERNDYKTSAEAAEKRVAELEKEVKDLGEQVKMLDGKISVLEDKLDAVEGGGSMGDLQKKIGALQASLKEARANTQRAAQEGLQMYEDGFAEALKQIAITHPTLVLDQSVVNAGNQAEGSTIVNVDPRSKEKTTVFYFPA